jgi:LytS/YehU family sensor histidine kinase
MSLWQSLLQTFLYLPVLIPATYFTIFFLIKKYLFRKNYFLFILYFLISGFCFALINRLIFFYIAVPEFYAEFAERIYSVGLFNPRELLSFFISVISLIAFAGFVTLITDWYSHENARQQLMKEKYEAELKFLKTQIHPHFLFNMLNNLYALSLKKSDKTPEMILKISSLLDYMLHEANSSSVTLGREIEVLEDYIELEKIRYGEKIHLTLNMDGNIDGKRIAPLLLLPFLENSFKHGAGEELNDAWISLSIKTEGPSLSMQLANSRSKSVSQDNNSIGEKIGFENVKKRLNLLYDDGYTLDIKALEDTYTVFLKINLDKLKI